MLRVEIDKKTYGTKKIIQNICFSLEEGQMLLIIAPSGCGKTTLINCILQRTKYQGHIRTTKGRNKVAYISQENTLDERETLYDSVYYTARYERPWGNEQKNKELVEKKINDLGLAALKHQKICYLSGGQKKRAQIAQELIKDTDVIIADEPDSGLDCWSSFALLKDLAEVVHSEKKKAIVISHNVLGENIALFDQVLVLAKNNENVGTIAYYGRAEFLYKYFGKKSMVQIMQDLQTKEERGNGKSELYTQMYAQLTEEQKNFLQTGNWKETTKRKDFEKEEELSI